MTRAAFRLLVASLLAAAWMSSAGAAATSALAVPGAASAASAPQARHGSPYVRAARQRALEASASAAPKVNPLVQHRPRMPTSRRSG
jgi:hypothetical protein